MLRLLALVLMMASATTPALAHLDAGASGSLLAGLSHPPSGTDHVLAMVTVGVWAGLLGGRAVWLVPTTFIAAMTLGYVAALNGLVLLFVEPTVLASVVVLGLLTAVAIKIPVVVGLVLVAASAVFHGFAHGAEVGSAGVWSFAFGFALSTAVLHACGIGVAWGLMRGLGGGTGRAATRAVGATAALCGLMIAFT